MASPQHQRDSNSQQKSKTRRRKIRGPFEAKAGEGTRHNSDKLSRGRAWGILPKRKARAMGGSGGPSLGNAQANPVAHMRSVSWVEKFKWVPLGSRICKSISR